MTPAEYCRARTRKAHSSFYYPMLLLPAAARQAMFALYAYCREVDDAVDNSWDPQRARHDLAVWRRELKETFQGRATHPVTLEILRASKHYPLPAQLFHEILNGMEMDLDQNRYQSLAELKIYCRKVAVAVGRLAVRIFGLANPEADRFALNLGLALQLTNILRDVVEDARRGRIYLPGELLRAHGVAEVDILDTRWTPALAEVMTVLADEAEMHFLKAKALANLDRRRLLPAILMGEIYQAQLDQLRRARFDLFSRPVGLSTLAKGRIALVTLGRELWRQFRTRNP